MAMASRFSTKLATTTKGIVFLPLLFILLASTRCAAQDISVRLLDARNGRPYAHRFVVLEFRRARTPVVEQISGFPPVKAETNNDGTASFHVPDGSPGFVEVLPKDNLYLCSDLLPVELRVIITTGVVSHCDRASRCHCKVASSISTLAPTPTQFVLLARPRTLWERLVHRLFPE